MELKRSQYRQRIYRNNETGIVSLVYEDQPAPENSELLADHDVIQVTLIEDHKND